MTRVEVEIESWRRGMQTVDDVRRMALDLPQVDEGERYGHLTWRVDGAAFAWVRPFSKADLRRFGDSPVPAGEILALSVADLSDKQAVLAAHAGVVFTIEHFENFPAVLVQLAEVEQAVLRALLLDAWCAKAPAALVDSHLGGGGG